MSQFNVFCSFYVASKYVPSILYINNGVSYPNSSLKIKEDLDDYCLPVVKVPSSHLELCLLHFRVWSFHCYFRHTWIHTLGWQSVPGKLKGLLVMCFM